MLPCIEGKIGRNGDLIGAPEGGALGELVDQKPMNTYLTDPALRESFWALANELWAFDADALDERRSA